MSKLDPTIVGFSISCDTIEGVNRQTASEHDRRTKIIGDVGKIQTSEMAQPRETRGDLEETSGSNETLLRIGPTSRMFRDKKVPLHIRKRKEGRKELLLASFVCH